MDVRKCEAPDCGMKLPPYVPRIRREEDGLLVCPNCVEGRPGRPRAHSSLRHTIDQGNTQQHIEINVGDQVHGRGVYAAEVKELHPDTNELTVAEGDRHYRIPVSSVSGHTPRTAMQAVASLFHGPEEHAANHPDTWQVEKVADGAWHLKTKDGGVLDQFPTKTKAEEAKTTGFLADLYDQERRWYAGESIRGWKPYADLAKDSSLRTVAHDSGDGKTIYHCPFCGAGQVVAGSDGTTECQFCHTFFTVQVQPEFASFPQTINGQPVQVPGMPGDPTQPSPSPDGPAGGEEGTAFQPPDQPEAFQPPDEPQPEDKPNPFQASKVARMPSSVSDHEATPEWDTAQFHDLCETCGWPVTKKGDTWVHDEKNPTQWSDKRKEASRLYVVPEGVAIPEDSFMRRLALEHAPDREAMLADLRASR